MRLFNGLILIGLLSQVNFVWADIFRHETDNGEISFSDKPSRNAVLIKAKVSPYRYKHQVKRVYDGDTIILENGDRIRLLGINTPEIKSHHRQGEVGGQVAKQWLKDKLHNGSVLLEYDVQKKDKYGRLLAHLFLDNGEHLNKQLLQQGLATLSIIPPNLRHADELQQAELMAQEKGQGIWTMDNYQAISIVQLSKDRPSGWQRFLASASRIKSSRKYSRLILNEHVDIRIPKENLALFPKLDSYLEKPLEIRGWASRNKNHFSILVRHPSAIVFLETPETP